MEQKSTPFHQVTGCFDRIYLDGQRLALVEANSSDGRHVQEAPTNELRMQQPTTPK